MAAIQNIDEPWEGHTFKEIEDFIKNELKRLQEEIDEL